MSSSMAFAKKVNFIEAHQLRLSGQQDPLHWIVPFHSVKQPDSWETNILFSQEKDVLNLYDDLQSKDQEKIQKRLGDSFGQPYDASAKLNLGFRSGDFAQFFSANAGAVLLVTDPVFPDLKGFLFQDYTSSTSYIFRPVEEMILKVQINLGVRRFLDETYSAGDLVSKKISVNFGKKPFLGFAEFSLRSIYSFGSWGQGLLEINSLPLMDNQYSYWDSFLGYKTPNFFTGPDSWLKEFALYGGYSPFYGGDYDVSRTQRVGLRMSLGEALSLDVFTFDKFYPGALLSSRLGIFELSLFTFERAYDDFGRQKSRQFGFNLKTSW